jgi:hypothetical protein
MKRAVVLFDAGASIDYGAPCTWGGTNIIEQQVRADADMQHTGGDDAYLKIYAGFQIIAEPRHRQF